MTRVNRVAALGAGLSLLALAGCGDNDASVSVTAVEQTSPVEEPTEPDPDPDPDPEPDPGDGQGTRENPYSVGDTVPVGDWEVTITSVNHDAEDEIMAENQFNDPPAEGRQFVMVSLDATYVGDDSGLAWIDLQFSFVTGSGNTTGTSMDDYCGVTPGSLFDHGEQFPGATVSGNECFAVPADDIDGGMLIVHELFWEGDDRAFVAIS